MMPSVLPFRPGDPFALHGAAAGGHDDSDARPSHRRIYDRLAWQHVSAISLRTGAHVNRERLWSADPAMADAGMPILAVGTRRRQS